MKGLFALAWRFFRVRRGRAIFSVLGVSLSIMLLTVSQILMVSIENSVEEQVKQKYGEDDLRVGYQTSKLGLSDAEVGRIMQLTGVKRADQVLYPYIGQQQNLPEIMDQPLYVGINPSMLATIHEKIVQGRFPKQGEVAFYEDDLKAKHLQVGSVIEMPFPPYGKKKVRISGALKRKEKAGPTAVFDLQWLRQATGKQGKTTVLFISLYRPEQKEEVVKELKKILPDAEINKRSFMDQERENLSGIRPIVQGIAITVIIAGSFIVVSTLQMSMRERQRDLATLRLIGAKRNQLGKIVLIESLLIAGLATAAGILGGIAAAYGLQGITENIIGVKHVGIAIPWGKVALYGLGANFFILLTGLIPAFTASRLSPVEAFRQEVKVEPGPGKWKKWSIFWLLLSCLVCSTLTYLFKAPEIVYVVVGLGFALVLMMGLPILLQWTVQLVGIVLKPFFRSEGLLAGRNALRQMGRSRQIAAIFMLAVMIGCIGTMVLTSVLIQAEKDHKKDYPVDYVIHAAGASNYYHPGGLNPRLLSELKQIPGIKTAALHTRVHVITLNLKKSDPNYPTYHYFHGQKQASIGLSGLQMNDINQLTPIPLIEGTWDQKKLRSGGVVITKKTSETFGYRLGDSIKVIRDTEKIKINADLAEQKLPRTITLKVVGIIKILPVNTKDEFGMYTDPAFIVRNFGVNTLESIYYTIERPSLKKSIQNQTQLLLQNPNYSNSILYDRAEEWKKVQQQFRQRWALLLAAIAMMTGLAYFGLMNSMAGGLRERIREFAILRAIGSSPRQVVRLAVIEGMMITTAGGLVGIIAGITLGYHLLAGLEAKIFPFPTEWVLGSLILSPFIGIIASLGPSLWMGKQDLIRTLQHG
ncbi:FtsX-like permease family protein [Paenactinomyces guangxiensis]|uniref:FtsX-like permease family protein n=1 Tax=Paenactinomyces guangxiensis TaxID=1490290 RepID=A0A7W2A8X8_9BACL|nr:FtsX-like permease family protein [Paenactinomyces guangxiensis]MBA4494659.1 FtsX-like permease family protein [Paenactinomyces guangxiensis]MBH8591743.1 FtsX-like permease family protein [Paenactinomyces guangxiensis]